jgi:hypothetical protein
MFGFLTKTTPKYGMPDAGIEEVLALHELEAVAQDDRGFCRHVGDKHELALVEREVVVCSLRERRHAGG